MSGPLPLSCPDCGPAPPGAAAGAPCPNDGARLAYRCARHGEWLDHPACPYCDLIEEEGVGVPALRTLSDQLRAGPPPSSRGP